ncbi:MAG TPA: alpha/beta fold hydrolase, partial [Ktedonobacterales bacterium]
MTDDQPQAAPANVPAVAASEGKPAGPRLSRTLLINGLALLLLLAGYGVALFGVVRGQAGIARRTFTLGGAVPVPVLRLDPATRQGDAIAIVVHGFASDKELMTSVGLALARTGVPSLLLDAPGFGQSPVGEAVTDNQALHAQWMAMMDEAVAYARANAGVPNPRIVVIGHSMGAFIVGLYAQAEPPDAVAATILISGALTTAPSTSQPANLLVIAGRHDLPGILPLATHTVAAACGGSLPASGACGDPARGTGRRLVVVPGANHISIITDPVALGAVNAWVATTDGLPAPAAASADNGPVNWLLVGVVCALLALFPLLALLTEALGLRAARGAPGTATLGAAVGGRARRVWPRAVGLATLATAGGTAVLLLWVYLAYVAAPPALASPLAWIHLEVGDVAASLVLLIAGVLAL